MSKQSLTETLLISNGEMQAEIAQLRRERAYLRAVLLSLLEHVDAPENVLQDAREAIAWTEDAA